MDQKIALITGASRGLGAALAEALAPSHHVIAVARTTGALEELDDRIKAKGGQATLAPMDVNNADAMAHLCRSIFDRWGKVDFWAHTAVHAHRLVNGAYADPRRAGIADIRNAGFLAQGRHGSCGIGQTGQGKTI